MRNTYIIFTLVLSVLFVIEGCGGGLFINKEYIYESSQPRVQLAIIPTVGNNAELIDSIFVLIFEDSLRAQDILKPKIIRNKIANDQQLTNLINKLGSVEYSKSELEQNPSVLNTLTNDEFTYLRKQLEQPSIILFPISLNIASGGVITSGFAKIRLYDFDSGALIYEHSQNLNVELGGEDGKTYMAIGLIGFAKDDYNKYFWHKFIDKN
jgi:hypothetical protein